MQTDFVILSLSLIVLLFPRRWLRQGKRIFPIHRKPGSDSPSLTRHPWDKSLSAREEFSKIRNHIDFLRGAVGSYGLMNASFVNPAALGSNGAFNLFALQILILAFALAVQTMHWGNRHTTHPPIFFLGGISVGLVGVPASICAFAAVWALCELIANPSIFIALQSVAIIAFGFLLSGLNRLTLSAGALAFVPLVFSAVLRRPLAIGSHKVRA